MIEASELQSPDKYELVAVNGEIVIQVDESRAFTGGGDIIAAHEPKGRWMEVADNTFVSSPLTLNPPIIQEENSSDKFIGHLEEFEIQTADDGTLLPSTAKAKMADGTCRRITLYPQLADGGVTCMVHFENEVVHSEELSTSLSEKIDSIICQNESIISEGKTAAPKKNERNNLSLLKQSLPMEIDAIDGKPKNNIFNPKKDTIDSAYQFIKHKEKLRKFATKSRTVPTVQSKQAARPDNITDESLPLSTNGAESSGICIKTSPEYFSATGKNDQRLGSNENPITLLQSGEVYHSQQPLSETQLRHLSSILKSQRNNPNSRIDKNVVIDPKTKTKIVYRVVYPDEDSNPSEEKVKRTKKVKAKSKEMGTNGESESLKDVVETGNGKDAKIPPPVVLKSARTRSGRLSRPPKHMIRDYKRLQMTVNNVATKKADADVYVDYKSAEDDVPAPLETPTFFLNSGRKGKKKNFKSEYRCPTCQKIYLGHEKMMLHLRKFPDHSNLDEYLEIYSRARMDRKKRPLNICKLKQVINGVDKFAYGPLLATSFSLWDFLLFRINLMLKNGNGESEIDALLKELTFLLENLKKIAGELLCPVYDGNINQEDRHVTVDKLDIAYAMGIPQGTYKINSEKLDLLRLNKNEPSAPPPPPPKPLATKFEPNLSTKLLDCSNDSIDLDSSSKDVEAEDDKKEWSREKTDEFLTDFLQSELPSSEGETLGLWKPSSQVPSSPPHVLSDPIVNDAPIWKRSKPSSPQSDLPIWKDAAEVADTNMWIEPNGPADETALDSWNERRTNGVWKDADDGSIEPATKKLRSDAQSTDLWPIKSNEKPWEKDGKKDWLKQWKEETGGPGLRSVRLTSTPETHGSSALLSPPLRRNSVSSFVRNHQEELLNLEFQELFGDLISEQGKPRRAKQSSIESILNEALFADSEPPPSHNSLPTSLIPDTLDEVTNLDFLNAE